MVDPLLIHTARHALRASCEDELILDHYLEAASAAVLRYLKWTQEDYASADDGDRRLVDNSIIILAGHYYRSPDVDDTDAFAQGQLPWMVTASLYQLRDPALA